ncbi:hypothetical protein [Caballeronia sordidicola]|nr:hypothetical protein [Caballeronia sordidicola]
MMKVAAKIFVSMLIAGMSAGVHAQASGNLADGASPALMPNPAAPGSTMPSPSVTGSRSQTSTGLSKGTDGVISSMRSNGTRTTESSNLRPPNRTGTMPGTR